MEDIQTLVASALHAIGAAQAFAIALMAGFIMKDYNQTAVVTLGALTANALVGFGRQALGGQPFETLVKSSWQSFLTLPMGAFLAALISFGLVICITFSVKGMLKKL